MIDMRIDKYHILSSQFEVAVFKMYLDDDGNQKMNIIKGEKVPVEKPIMHYSTLKQALSGIRQNMLRTGSTAITTIDEYRAESNRINKLFDDFMDQQLPKSKY